MLQECKGAANAPHPVVEIVGEEIPIFEFLVEFLVDLFRMPVQILGKTCKFECQTQRLKTC